MKYFVFKKTENDANPNLETPSYLAYLTSQPDWRGLSDSEIKRRVKRELKNVRPKLKPEKYELNDEEEIRIQPNFDGEGMGEVIHNSTWIEIKIPKNFKLKWNKIKRKMENNGY